MKDLSFAALRHPGFRIYFVVSALAMMADSIEHVISYWMVFQKFHSQTLGGFAVVSRHPLVARAERDGAARDHRGFARVHWVLTPRRSD